MWFVGGGVEGACSLVCVKQKQTLIQADLLSLGMDWSCLELVGRLLPQQLVTSPFCLVLLLCRLVKISQHTRAALRTCCGRHTCLASSALETHMYISTASTVGIQTSLRVFCRLTVLAVLIHTRFSNTWSNTSQTYNTTVNTPMNAVT